MITKLPAPEVAARTRIGWRIIPMAVLFLIGLYVALSRLIACAMLTCSVASSWSGHVPNMNWLGILRLFACYALWLVAGCLLLLGVYYLQRERSRLVVILIVTATATPMVSRLLFQPIPI